MLPDGTLPDDYVVLDLETTGVSWYRDTIIEFGAVKVVDRKPVDTYQQLVNPMRNLNPFITQLTGITPEMVRGQPDFSALWQLLKPMLEESILVAHNAPFDLRVLASCLHDYHIDWKPEAAYLCTCQMGRKAYPYLQNHKLNTLCDHLRLELDHHNAGSDSRACALLLLDYLEKGLRPEPFLRTYRFADRKTLPYCAV